MGKLEAWARQPTSVAGLATIFGTLSALLTHQLSIVQATPILAGAIMSIALPDNSAAPPTVDALVSGSMARVTRITDKEGKGA